MNKIFKVGLIGCGHISETYFRAEKYFNNIKIIKCADINHKNALKCAKNYKIKALSVKELLKDSEVEIILNLTIPKAHYQVAKQALLNGKHVYSEKPLAINFKDGKELLKLSKRKKLYIGNAPDTFLGGGIQKSKELVDKNIIGKIANLDLSIDEYTSTKLSRVEANMLFNKSKLRLTAPLFVETNTAKMKWVGQINKDYKNSLNELDLNLDLRIRVGENLPWYAAILGGLPAVAGSAVINKVFEEDINNLSNYQYEILGTISQPELRRIK